MARIYREAPLNSVWEGSANMMCMDVRRSLCKDPTTQDAFMAEVNAAKGMDRRFDAYLEVLQTLIQAAVDDEFLARPACEAMARAVQGAELLRHSSTDVVDAFMNTRLNAQAAGWGSTLGSLGASVSRAQASRIVDRARVAC